jgi:hypothetical protein
MWPLALSITLLMSTVLGAAYADTPPFESCYNSPDETLCGLTTNPFGSLMGVFDQVMVGFGLLLLWGPITFGIWWKTQSAGLTGIFGVLLAGTLTGLHPTAVNMGIVLLSISLGIGLIQIFQRVKQTV